MHSIRTHLTDFLNHGIMPFIGRDRELAKIRAFRRETVEATALRSLLITGEAGIGKSRIVEEIVREAEGMREIVIHCKPRPESVIAPVLLLRSALLNAPSAAPLLRQRIAANMGDVVNHLRRLSRLRPTLLIFEDLHLLDEEERSEFGTLLQTLTDDPIALLCTQRPLTQEIVHILLPTLIEEIRLEGLSEAEIVALSTSLLGGEGGEEAIQLLHTATHGNPLALRSALRGALNKETILSNDRTGWSIDNRFGSVIRESALSFSEGLAVHLTSDEREASEQLALLGEVFSREAAEYLLDNRTGEILEALLFKGIIVKTFTTGTPLSSGMESTFPLLSFTHSMVHHRMREEGEEKVNLQNLVNLILKRPPLYSILPFSLLQHFAAQRNLPIEQIPLLFRTVCDIALPLGNTAEWKQGLRLLETATILAKLLPETGEERVIAELHLHYALLELSAREVMQKEYMQRLNLFLQQTEQLPPHLAEYRLHALNQYHFTLIYRLHDTEELQKCLESVDALIGLHPELQLIPGFRRTVENKLNHGRSYHRYKLLEDLERELETLVADENTPEEARQFFQKTLQRDFLTVVRSADDLQKRLQQIDEVELHSQADQSETRYLWLFTKRSFFVKTGFVKPLLRTLQEAYDRSRRTGRENDLFVQELEILKCQMSLGLPIPEVERLNSLLAQREAAKPARGSWYAHVSSCALIGFLRGEAAWASSWYRENHPDDVEDTSRTPVLLALYNGSLASATASIQHNPFFSSELGKAMTARISGEESDVIASDFGEPLLTFLSFIDRWILLRVETLVREDRNGRIIADDQRVNLLDEMFTWLDGRQLWIFIEALLKEFGENLARNKRERWQERIEELRSANLHEIEVVKDAPARIQVSMVDTISIQMPGKPEPIRPRGERLKTLLGVMVADLFLPQALERDDFLRIASGTIEPKSARDIVNNGVSRLRSLFGQSDAILTDGPTPRLNNNLIDVDLLESLHLLNVAQNSLQSATFMRALPAIESALEIWGGAVPFPTLYDEFFESLRERFEVGIRGTTLQLAKQLVEEGDRERAHDILKTLHNFLPEDGEVTELLRTYSPFGQHRSFSPPSQSLRSKTLRR